MTSNDQFYHVLNRGNEKKSIFFETENYLFFLRQLTKYIKMYGPILVAYCLMPNHFHLLLKEIQENGISKCLHALQTSYAKAVNKRYERSGHLFQDSYQKIMIKDDSYLVYLSRYIHLNPVKAGLASRPEDWEFSSYRDYIGMKREILSEPEIILSQFRGRQDYHKFVMDNESDKELGLLTLE
jgi:putative transposase